MTKMQSLLVSAALAIGMAAPVSAATTDPEVIIYRFSSVATLPGASTVINCTNISGAPENVRFVIRDHEGVIRANVILTIPHVATRTLVTRQTVAFPFHDLNLSLTNFSPGSAAIAATSPNIFCTAMLIDDSASAPVGIVLPGVRFNPIAGSQE